MSDVACHLASVQADLDAPSLQRDQNQADCVSIQQQFPQAQAELATLPQGQWGTQGAGRALVLHYLQSHGRTE
jgi:hypothetical protein